MFLETFFFFGYLFSKGCYCTCPCSGVVLEGTDQKHCWQLESRPLTTWTSADDACQAVGGHMGHPEGDMFDNVLTYIDQSATLPVLTGIVAGNVEVPVIARMCQNNKFYDIITNTTDMFENKPTVNTSCVYLAPGTPEFVFASCSISSMVLCDRPLEVNDYCSIMANCSSTTTMTSTTSVNTSTTEISSTPTSSYSTSVSTSTVTALNSTSTPSTSSSSGTTTSTPSTSSISSTMSTSSSPVSNTTVSPTSTISTTSISSNSTIPTNLTQSTMTTSFASSTRPTTTLSYNSSTTMATTYNSTSVPTSAASVAVSTAETTLAAAQNDQSVTTPTTTTTPSPVVVSASGSNSATSAPVSCSTDSKCLKHQFKLFGMCIDWRALLALLLIGLALFLCCCLCHYCLHACMWCTPRRRKDNILPVDSPRVAPTVLEPITPVNYLEEKEENTMLPPAAIVPEPVIVTIPERHESVYGFHSKEIIHLLPEKPETREIGVNTDPIVQELDNVSITPPPPVIKKKKVVKKPKKMFIPATVAPMDDFDEDVAEDIPLPEIRAESPGTKSIAPLGDAPNNAPLSFVRNAKPFEPMSKNPDDFHERKPFDEPAMLPDPAPMDDTMDPRNIRSPPMQDNKEPAKRMTFSPIADDSDDEPQMNAIPSPPANRRNDPNPAPAPDNNNQSFGNPNKFEEKPPLRNKRLNDPPVISPTEPNAGQNDRRPPPSNNPFANLGPSPTDDMGNGNDGSSAPNSQDVAMRAARGKMGGAVRGGGGGGDAPLAWKPWAKNNNKK